MKDRIKVCITRPTPNSPLVILADKPIDLDIDKEIMDMFAGEEDLPDLLEKAYQEYDPVNQPEHYTHGNIECIDAMVESQGREAVKNFCICNAFKYIWRAKYKNGVEDIRKANWYINKYLDLEQGDMLNETV